MSNRIITFALLLTAAAAVLEGQAPGHSLKTPWGEPDLQGLWTSEPELGVPFERSKEFGERQTLTDAEFAARQAQAAKQFATDNAEFDVETADTANAGAVGSATSPPPHWLERGQPSRRTSIVIDPPDGRVPALSAEAQARQRRGVRGSFGNGPFNSHEDFTLYDRCITRGVPNAIYPAVYNANTRVVQGPGYVAISYEMIHETRVVPIDSRPSVAVRPAAVSGRRSRALGRRHARDSHGQLQRPDVVPRRQRQAGADRALPARGRGDLAL